MNAVTAVNHGSSAASACQRRRTARLAKAVMSQLQNSSDPAWPPHMPVRR